MTERRITLFTLAGFRIRADVSWVFIAVLISWSLATGLFPSSSPGLSAAAYWILGIAGTSGLFASIIVHELIHSLVARRFGIPIEEITLFIFGGVANMDDEPPSARAELWMAAAGPLASALLGVLLFASHRLLASANAPGALLALFGYLWVANFALAAFNLVPAYPLDGGRILRAALWKWRGDIRGATRIASFLGGAFGITLILLGIYQIVGSSLFIGLWWVMIGMFVRSASRMSYQKLLMVEGLKGKKVRRFMETDVVTVSAALPVTSLVEDYVYTHHHKMFPVVQHERLRGCVTTVDIKRVPREAWDRTTIGEITKPCDAENTVGPDADAIDALNTMSRSQNSRLMVVEDGRLVGVIALKDLLEFLSLKLDLEQGGGRPR